MKVESLKKQTFCRICEASCALEVSVEAGAVARIEPRKGHHGTLGFACMKGLAQGEMYSSPDRLTTPAKHFDHIENTAFLALQRISDRVVAVGARGVIAFSDDNGDSWEQSYVPISTLLTSVYFPNKTLN